ncbi:MAG: GDYXXLXY domain-containing protein [Alphaproteobacteria bacterium]|nr:GDYXXLXY domain-containing protein [Alphaproteobacteria bacterium]
MPKVRFGIALFMLLVATVLMAKAINDKETLLAEGREVLLEIGPRDPRSLMQGDYMTLRYGVADMPDNMAVSGKPYQGLAVLKLDENRVASFARFADEMPLGDAEVHIRYRRTRGWGDTLRLAPESYFFEEGTAERYEAARYVILHVGGDGSVLITGLADENFKKIS